MRACLDAFSLTVIIPDIFFIDVERLWRRSGAFLGLRRLLSVLLLHVWLDL